MSADNNLIFLLVLVVPVCVLITGGFYAEYCTYKNGQLFRQLNLDYKRGKKRFIAAAPGNPGNTFYYPTILWFREAHAVLIAVSISIFWGIYYMFKYLLN
jgi:hypothetical protein